MSKGFDHTLLTMQARANKTRQGTGKLGEKLASQKAGNAALKQYSEEERAYRDQDANHEARAWN
jgi:hypothetical protein